MPTMFVTVMLIIRQPFALALLLSFLVVKGQEQGHLHNVNKDVISRSNLRESLLPSLVSLAQTIGDRLDRATTESDGLLSGNGDAHIQREDGILSFVKDALGQLQDQKVTQDPLEVEASAQKQLSELLRLRSQPHFDVLRLPAQNSRSQDSEALATAEDIQLVPDETSTSAQTEFQQRMQRVARQFVRFADDVGSQSAESAVIHDVKPESFTLGPLNTTESLDVEFDINKLSLKQPEVLEYSTASTNCADQYIDNLLLRGPGTVNENGTWSLNDCILHCKSVPSCNFFSFVTSLGQCHTFLSLRTITKAAGVISGPVTCESVEGSDGPYQNETDVTRRLQGVEFSSSDYKVSTKNSTKVPMNNCLAEDTGIQGHWFSVVNEVDSANNCQRECVGVKKCNFFSFLIDDRSCYMYDIVTGVINAKNLVSGPKYCLESSKVRCKQWATYPRYYFFYEAAQNKAPRTDGGGPAGPLVGLDQPIEIADASQEITEESAIVDNAPQPDESNIEKSFGGAETLIGDQGLLGRLFGIGQRDDALLEHQQWKASEGSPLQLDGVFTGAVSDAKRAFSALTSLMEAGDTIFKTLPVKDVVRAGYLLRNSGILDRKGKVKGGRRGSGATQPPAGVANPDVTCLSEGMRCCVPRIAAPRYKVDPPTLNGIDSPRCTASYVSQSDQLCATTKYKDTECNTAVLEIETVFIYRNIMEMPGLSMNNAICECSIQKEAGPQGEKEIISSGKWEYSLSAYEQEQESREDNAEATKKFNKFAKAAFSWGQTLLGQPKSTSHKSGSATHFLDTLVSLFENPEAYDQESLTTEDDEAMKRLYGNMLAGPKPQASRRHLTEEDTTEVMPMPYTCSVWLEDCETSLEKLIFDQACKPVRILQNGCSREDSSLSFDVNATNPVYKLQIPSIFRNHALGIACDFQFKARSNLSDHGLCLNGTTFPRPDQDLTENWPFFRERGPLLELLLTLMPQDEVFHALPIFAAWMGKSFTAPHFYASNYEVSNAGNVESNATETSPRQLTDKVTVLLTLNPAMYLKDDEARLSALFSVNLASHDKNQMARVEREYVL